MWPGFSLQKCAFWVLCRNWAGGFSQPQSWEAHFSSHLFWPNPFNCWSFLQSALLLILPYAVVLRNIVVQFGGGCVGNVITGGSWSSHCVPGESGQCGRLSWPPGVRPHLSLLQQDTTDWENPTMHSIHPQIVDKDGRRKFDHQKMGGGLQVIQQWPSVLDKAGQQSTSYLGLAHIPVSTFDNSLITIYFPPFFPSCSAPETISGCV